MKHLLTQRGFVSLIAVLLIFVFGFLSIMAVYSVNATALSAKNNILAAQAFYMAESGLEYTRHKLTDFPSTYSCSGISGNSTFTNISFNGSPGTFTVTATGTQSGSPSTLSSFINSTTTTIPAVSTSGYDTSGQIMIDKEIINYTAISGNNFINATRGVNGSKSRFHWWGSPIGQFQCTMVSQGGVPNLTTQTVGKRTLQEVLQLSTAWTAGSPGFFSTKLPIYRWNRPTEFSWNNYSLNINNSAKAIYSLSYADTWIVGQNYFLEHWDGNSLSASTAPAGTKHTLYGVTCTDFDNCWAVGDTQIFLSWNGSSWSVQSVVGIPNVTYRAVDCVDSNDCWAVGDASAGDVFVHWNGTAWARNASNPTPSANLTGISCTATDNCWAVGANSTFVHWNGTSWANQTVAGLTSDNYSSVNCVANDDCWAVGSTVGDNYAHWDGTAWSRDASRPGAAAGLNSVHCSASNNCWAVGNGPVTIHWNGSSWAFYSNPGPFLNSLNAVTSIGPFFTPNTVWKENYP